MRKNMQSIQKKARKTQKKLGNTKEVIGNQSDSIRNTINVNLLNFPLKKRLSKQKRKTTINNTQDKTVKKKDMKISDSHKS